MPYWSQERMFGRWGPTHRTAFRFQSLVLLVVALVGGYYLLQFYSYVHKVDTYVHESRANRIATQKLQNQQIHLAQVANRDLACFVVAYANRVTPKNQLPDPFIQALSDRYDCTHYVLPRTSVPGGSALLPGGSPQMPATPSVTPTPASSPSAGSTRTVTASGPTRTRTRTVTPTPRPSSTHPPPSQPPPITVPHPPILPSQPPVSVCLPIVGCVILPL